MRHALGGAPSRCDLRSNSAARYVTGQRRALCDVTLLGPTGAHERGNSFADRRPPKDGEAPSGPRKTSLRWAPQEPTKLATVSQFAAPGDGEASF